MGIGTAAPNSSAILDITSSTKGLLIPRMSLSDRNGMTPVTSLLIYQTDNNPGYYYYNGIAWTNLSADNLGNHSMSANLWTNGYFIARNPSNNMGLQLLDSGAVRIVTNGNYNSNPDPSDKAERFKFDQWGGFYAKGDLTKGYTPVSGSGTRLMWYPAKGAIRAGSVAGTYWDDENTGYTSTAFGYNTKAAGTGSTAFGSFTEAIGESSTALGSGTKAWGVASFATGLTSEATGDHANAMGINCIASGDNSFAIGNSSIASGTSGIAMGYISNADANYSVALGNRAQTDGHTGAFVFADASTTDSLESSANNQYMARFAGGYRLYTNATMTTGVGLNAGGSSWNVVSDVRKKENFETADAENFLIKLNKIELGSWNYKGQDVATFRHYGPMAQDIFAAYGKDNFGTIGCDTLLASADMDGIMMILIKGLEQRTTEQKKQIQDLQYLNQQLMLTQDERIKLLEAEIKRLSIIVSKQKE